MSSVTAWFGYGFGAEAARAILGDRQPASRRPIRHQTEEEILADEKRYAEDAKQLDAEDAAAKK